MHHKKQYKESCHGEDGRVLGHSYRLMRQQIVDAMNPGKVAGYEITMQPISGLPVEELIQQVKDNSLLADLDLCVVSSVASMMKYVEDLDVPVWINLFPSTLLDEKAVQALLSMTRTYPGKFCFEVTEAEMIIDYGVTLYALNRLRKAGAGIVMDDFGAGASSIRSMLELGFDIIKIDGHVFRLCAEYSHHCDLIRAIITSAHAEKSLVVAEGVETLKQANIARAMGADLIQGYYYAMPEPLKSTSGLSLINKSPT